MASKPKREDANERAARVVREATGQEPPEEAPRKNPHAVALGRKGGKKGGLARAKKLTARRRKAIATKAAKARWSKKKK